VFSILSVRKLYSESHQKKLARRGSEVVTFGAMSWVRDSRQPVTTGAEEDIVGIGYQATASEDVMCAIPNYKVCELARAL
jgi:hypothetical protein